MPEWCPHHKEINPDWKWYKFWIKKYIWVKNTKDYKPIWN